MTTTSTSTSEKPILMSGPMVRAILDGKKTQTRRVIKPQPDSIRVSPFVKSGLEDNHGYEIKARYYPGDLLWVRETWQALTREQGLEWNIYYGDMTPEVIKENWYLYHRADDGGLLPDDCRWRPSIFMPRWASRITLEITDVRVERLQDITEADAIAEGVYTNDAAIKKLGLPADTRLTGSCVDKYRIVWESINGKTYPWSSNPWVWSISFRRVEVAG